MIVDSGAISLSITDNGKGFDMEKVKMKKGVGLYNIANRTELFNGKMNMVTSPGGTSAEAIYQMEKGSLRTVLSKAVWSAYQRAESLGKR